MSNLSISLQNLLVISFISFSSLIVSIISVLFLLSSFPKSLMNSENVSSFFESYLFKPYSFWEFWKNGKWLGVGVCILDVLDNCWGTNFNEKPFNLLCLLVRSWFLFFLTLSSSFSILEGCPNSWVEDIWLSNNWETSTANMF
jgi:hypothetical protein